MAEQRPVTGSGSSPAGLAAWQRRVRVALGQEPADLVLAGGDVVDVFGGTLLRADVAIAGGRIAGVGEYPHARRRIDVQGKTVAPSFIDAHVHLESSLVWVPEFARATVPHGTGAVVADPHEIANVAGLPGMDAMRAAAAELPLRVAFTVPSCVPASPHESSGAVLDAEEIAAALAWSESIGLGELMNFPGVLAGDPDLFAKVAAAVCRRDGHAPGLRGPALQAYAGAGPGSDHESTELAEAQAKLSAGLMIMIREGSSEHNLRDLLPLVTADTYPRCCFASDDRDCHALLHDGHVDAILRLAIAEGLDPVRAIRMATWNAADYWRLDGLGAVAPGYEANLVVLDDLLRVRVGMTLYRGEVVARDGALLVDPPPTPVPSILRDSVHLAPVTLTDLRLAPESARVAVEAMSGQIVTRLTNVDPVVVDGAAVAAPGPERDLLKLICVERHRATGRVGVGYVRGFGLRRGALASTIAHDAHNVVAVGADDADLLAAIATVADSQGGLAAVADGRVLAHLPLPIAGILSDRPLPEVAGAYAELEDAARGLGSPLPSPFGLLAFMALSVIPEARVTDRGFLRVG